MSNTPTTARLVTWVRALATYDFSPRFSAKVRRFVYHPLGVLTLAALASLLCGLFLHSQGFVLCGGVLAVVALGVIWPWLSLRGLAGSVAFDRARASEGDTVEVRLTLRNRLPWPAWGLAVRGANPGYGASPPIGATDFQSATSWGGNRGGSWIWANASVNGYTAALTPNSPEPDSTAHGLGFLSARSNFSGGVNVCLGDGSVRFFRDSISITTWRALATRAGGEVINGNDY